MIGAWHPCQASTRKGKQQHPRECNLMISEENSRIGELIEITGSDFVAELISDEAGFVSEVTLGEDRVIVGQVGSYLTVKQSGIKVLTLVERNWREGTVDGPRRIRLIPLGEVSSKGAFSRGVNHFPSVGAEVHLVSASELGGIFADFGSAGYCVGRMSSFESMGVYFDPDSFFGRHVAILGQSGSGKSWSVTSLIQSALRAMPNAHVILLDLHGEYGRNEFDPTSHSAFPDEVVRCVDARELEIPYWLLTYAELIELFIDPDDEDASVQIAFLRETLFDLKKKANRDLDIGHISVDSPIFFSLPEMYMRFKQANEQTTDFGKVKSPLNGKFDQLLVKLQSRFNDTRYNFLLKPQKRTSSDSLAGLMRDFVGLGEPKAKVTVIDLSPVPFDIKPIITAQIGRLAFEFNFWNPRYREFPIFLVCEEAHSYIPREGDPRHAATRRTMERIAKEGRKYAVGMAVVSQRPHELSETVLAQCANFVCLRITNPDDQEYIRALVPDAARGILDALPSLSRGEAIAMGEAMPMPVRFKVTLPDPPPNSSDIDFIGQWKEGPEDISVEDIMHKWRKQER